MGTTLFVIAVIFLALKLIALAVSTFMPIVYGIAIFAIIKVCFEAVDDQFSKLFEGGTGIAILIVILGVILL